MPGVDPHEAAAVIAGELPELPHLVELPARGPGADMVGRAVALLVDLHADVQPSGWRLVDRPGIDERRARRFLDLTGIGIEELRGRAGEPALLAALVGFLEAHVDDLAPRRRQVLADVVGLDRQLAVAEAIGVKPEALVEARRELERETE